MLEPPLPAAKALPPALKEEASGPRARFGGSDAAGDPETGFDGTDKHVAQQSYQGRDGQAGTTTPEGTAQAGGLQTNATPAGDARRNRAGEEEEEEAVPAGGRSSRLINLMSCITPCNGPLYFFSFFAPSLPSSVMRPSFPSPPSSCGPPPPASAPSFPMVLALQKMLAVLVVVASILALITSVPGAQAEGTDKEEVTPVFLEPVPNVTVAEGRDASLSCTVDNLGQHRVAWIHLDRQMIVSIHNHVITRLSHFTVTHDSHKTWTLHVTSVTVQDRGHYMCQVNTVPMMSQTGYLQVVVPPNIDDKKSSKSNIVVREKDNVTLRCAGHGFPMPQIKWRREDSSLIETSDGKKVQQMDGPVLPLQQVSRTHMGAYLCIASNGVPPSVSKRITLDVEFAPQMHVPNQLVGAPKSTNVRLECFVEAHPKAITYWEFNDAMVMNTSRITTQTLENHYKIHMILDIRDLDDEDFGMYKCISKNSIAETDGSITLNETPRPTTPPQIKQSRPDAYDADGDIHYRSRGRPGRKEHYNRDPQQGRRRPQDPDGIKEEMEEEERREVEENRRKTQELERRRLEHDYNRGHLNEQATRVTHTPASAGADAPPSGRLLSASVLAALGFALFSRH